MILKFPRSFSEYSSNFFFQNFNEYYSKLKYLFNFRCTFSTVHQSLIAILLFFFFLQIPQIFFQRFTQSFNKITVKICSNFYFDLLKKFLASFQSDFKFILTRKLFFPNN